MSGPKGYSVRVESAEERRRREMAELRARCAEVQARCDEVSVELEGLRGVGVAIAVPRPSGTGLDALRRWESDLREVLVQAEEAHAVAKAAQRQARMLEAVGATPVATEVRIGLTGETLTSRSQTAATEAVRATWAQRIEELVELASQVDDEPLHQAVAEGAKAVSSLPAHEAEAQWMGLRHRVASTVQASRELARVRAEAADLVVRVSHLEGPAVDELKTRVEHARTSRDLSDLTRDVEAMIKDAEASADADFVTREAQAALTELGYQVDEPFDVVGVEAQAFLARRRDLPDHALRVQVSESQGTLLTSVVAKEGTTLVADATAERVTCGDAAEMMVTLERRGVRSDKHFERGPGEIAVRRELDGTVAKGRRRARLRAQSALTQPARKEKVIGA